MISLVLSVTIWRYYITIGYTPYWCWSSTTLATWCEEPTLWKRPWFWERLKAGGEGDNRGQDGCMASLTQWTWVGASSGGWLKDREAWCAAIHAKLDMTEKQHIPHSVYFTPVTRLSYIWNLPHQFLFLFPLVHLPGLWLIFYLFIFISWRLITVL